MEKQQEVIQKDLQLEKKTEDFTLKLPIQFGKCRIGNQIKFVCVSQNCKENSFMCSQETCECNSFHKECIKPILRDLILNIQKKIINYQDLVELNNKLLDQFVGSMSDQAQKLKEQFRLLASYFPINPNSAAVLQKLKNKKFSQCIGDQFFQVYSIFYRKNALKNIPQKIQQIDNMRRQFQQMMKKNKYGFEKYQNQIQKNFINQNSNRIEKNIFKNFQKNKKQKLQNLCLLEQQFNSKVASLNSQKYVISHFFDNKIKNIELLYRASEWNFMIQGFVLNCTQISHTLILAQTQYGKKIGGYTPLKWRKNRTIATDDKDQSQRSFIFSLTQNQKLKQKDKTSGIRNQLNNGPIFRVNESNKNNNCADICYGYQGQQKFKQYSDSNNKLFNGSSRSNNFKIIQWQVWKLTFEQQR